MLNQYRNILQSQKKVLKNTVSFNSNGGSLVDDVILAHGDIVPLYKRTESVMEPTKTSYKFGGWYTNTQLLNSHKFGLDVISYDRTLYARWLNLVYQEELSIPSGLNGYDHFGSAIDSTNVRVAISSPDDAITGGKIHIYECNTGTDLTFLYTIEPPTDTGYTYSKFGKQLALAGNYLIVHSEFSGTGDVVIGYDISSATTPTREFINIAVTGYDDGSLSGDGDYFTIFTTSLGKLSIYNAADGTLNKYVEEAATDHFTDIYGDYLLHYDSVYKISDGSLIDAVTMAYSPSTGKINHSYLIHGDYDADSLAGRVYIYSLPEFELIHTLTNPNSQTSSSTDQFGKYISINDTFLFVGAPNEEVSGSAGSNQGVVYVYNISTGTRVATFSNPSITNMTDAEYGLITCNDTDFVITAKNATSPTYTDIGRVFHYILQNE